MFIIASKTYQFKYNSSIREGLKEEAGLHWDHRGDKGEHMYPSYVILVPFIIVRVRPSQH
jgi:hypothetical protein